MENVRETFCESWCNLVPRAFPSKNGWGREKALASAGHVSILHPEILGVINLPGFARFA